MCGPTEWVFIARTYRGRYVWRGTSGLAVFYQMTTKDTPPSEDEGGYGELASLLKLKGDRIP